MSIQEELPMNETITTTITGASSHEVECLLDSYLKEYPMIRYGSDVTQTPKDLGGDLWEAKVKRHVRGY